jgi:hypothetical protein
MNKPDFEVPRPNTETIPVSGAANERQRALRAIHDRVAEQFPTPIWNTNNSLMFSDRLSISRILYFDNLYRQIVGRTGIICEFGVLYGATVSLLTNLRGIYEPYNFLRRIVGFDTFAGFPGQLTDEEKKLGWESGDFGVPDGYEATLAALLDAHEAYSPINHKRKFELVKGDVTLTFDAWLEANPSAVIALAIFDMDIYTPTKHVLERILPRMPRGAILAFDELNYPLFPGETQALREVLGLHNLILYTDPHNAAQAWCVIP